jgi:hypothetical protein
MGPEVIAAIVAAGANLVGMAVKFFASPDPQKALDDMRAELGKMQAAIGPGGDLEKALAKANDALDQAIAAEKARQASPNPTVLVDPAQVFKSDESIEPAPCCPDCGGPCPCPNGSASNGCAGSVYVGG